MYEPYVDTPPLAASTIYKEDRIRGKDAQTVTTGFLTSQREEVRSTDLGGRNQIHHQQQNRLAAREGVSA